MATKPIKERPIVNLAPQHKFRNLGKYPEAQLLLLAPRSLWMRTRVYIPHFELVELAGRFGAEPGDYEWEVIEHPHGLKWWRRTLSGDAFYCAAVIAPDVVSEPVEIYGLMDIASDSPWWYDALQNEALVELRSEVLSRQRNISVDEARLITSIEEQYRPRQMITSPGDENGVAWRVGDIDEVTRLKNALAGVIERARTAVLPEEALRKTGALKPRE